MIKVITGKDVAKMEDELSKIFSAVAKRNVPLEAFSQVTECISRIGVEFGAKGERIFGR